MGTAPVHQRRGLGKAVMCEGLWRLKEMVATKAFFSSYSAEADAFTRLLDFS